MNAISDISNDIFDGFYQQFWESYFLSTILSRSLLLCVGILERNSVFNNHATFFSAFSRSWEKFYWDFKLVPPLKLRNNLSLKCKHNLNWVHTYSPGVGRNGRLQKKVWTKHFDWFYIFIWRICDPEGEQLSWDCCKFALDRCKERNHLWHWRRIGFSKFLTMSMNFDNHKNYIKKFFWTFSVEVIRPTKINIWRHHFMDKTFLKMKLSKNSFYNI